MTYHCDVQMAKYHQDFDDITIILAIATVHALMTWMQKIW